MKQENLLIVVILSLGIAALLYFLVSNFFAFLIALVIGVAALVLIPIVSEYIRKSGK